MELHEALSRRAMCRSFTSDPIDAEILDRILSGALSCPTAGNTQGTAWVVLEGSEQTAAYWESTTDEAWRARNPGWSAGLSRAPVVLLAYTSPEAYVARYAESDKADPVLGAGADAWPVPYWYGDAAFGVMAVLLGAVDAGLGACVVGAFLGEANLARRLGVPKDWRLFCAVLIGRPDELDHRSRSVNRRQVAQPDRIRRVRW